MNQLLIASHQMQVSRPGHVALAALDVLRKRVATWSARQRGRRALLSFDEAALKDIGISRAQADFEYNKPFWRA